MATYNLKLSFSEEALTKIYSTGTKVVIAINPDVAWQVFVPLQFNTISWQDDYGIYVSPQEMVKDEPIVQMANIPVGAKMNEVYTLQPGGDIEGPTPPLPDSIVAPNSFTLQNHYTTLPLVTAGLYQDATVNGMNVTGNAISAVAVLSQSTALITISAIVIHIWLQSGVKSNSMVTTVTSPVTKLVFGNGVTDISAELNSSTGLFDPHPNVNSASNANELEMLP